MRFPVVLSLFASLTASCSSDEENSSQSWASGRDGLCLSQAGETARAGLITYGSGNANCSVTGSARRNGNVLEIAPTGDSVCRITVQLAGDQAVIGSRSSTCSYYCGPGADFAGKTLRRSDKPAGSIVDLAGDPLC